MAEAKQVQPHPRANRDVEIRALDPNGDDKLWEAVLELQVAEREEGREEEESYRAFARARLHDRRTLFRTGRGAWYVALDPSTEDVTASCGIVVTAGRGRFQAVETAAAYQRRGICSRLLVEAARHATVEYEAQRFVIVADLHYHALGLYESRAASASSSLPGSGTPFVRRHPRCLTGSAPHPSCPRNLSPNSGDSQLVPKLARLQAIRHSARSS